MHTQTGPSARGRSYDPVVPFRRLGLLLLAAAVAASLTSCDSGGSSLAALRHAPNGTDAAFLSSMTEHEKATLGITRLAERRALRWELHGIARTMTGEERANLRELGSLAPRVGSRGSRPPALVRPPTSAAVDLARVKDATSFDHEFMRTMVEQNQEAIAIAKHEVRYGSDPAAKRLAAAIAASRKKELDRIRAWLHLWYGDIQPPGGGGGNQQPSPGPSPGEPPPL